MPSAQKAKVSDPNALSITSFLPHAGLMATPEGLAKALLKWDQSFDFLASYNKIEKDLGVRFVHGFDQVQNVQQSLSGADSSWGSNWFPLFFWLLYVV